MDDRCAGSTVMEHGYIEVSRGEDVSGRMMTCQGEPQELIRLNRNT